MTLLIILSYKTEQLKEIKLTKLYLYCFVIDKNL